MIAAVARNGVIGDGRGMPWHVPEDLAYFKRTTMGHLLIMGRATFDSVGRPLPGRRSIVLTRDRHWQRDGVETAASLPQALELAGPADEVFVCGGGQVYAEAMPIADRLLVTEIDQWPELGSRAVLFPQIDPQHWQEVARVTHAGYAFVTYLRRSRGADDEPRAIDPHE